jgi:ABC-type glutathione transport system ATPase component
LHHEVHVHPHVQPVSGITSGSFVTSDRGHPETTTFYRITLTVPDGCLYGLIGPGASGKSILLKTVTGLMKPDRGSIQIDGEEVTRMTELGLAKVRLKIGMLFQNNALFDHMTVAENIAFPLRRLYQLPEEEIPLRVAERLKCVALPGSEDRLPSGLSGGPKAASASRGPRSRARRSCSTTSRRGPRSGQPEDLRPSAQGNSVRTRPSSWSRRISIACSRSPIASA